MAQIGVQMGITRNAAHGAVRRHVYKAPDRRRSGPKAPRVVVKRAKSTHHSWSEDALTETWAQRKIRRAAERAAQAG